MNTQAAPSVNDEPDALRYEAHMNSELAGFIDYEWRGDRRVLVHTEVLPGFSGEGIGSALARFAFEAALVAGRRVTVRCPFLRTYLERHPEYASISAPPRQGPGQD
ncbi:MAG: N-acetyltransferase [Chloroflexi bacterium]|nr:N-acetyltransferase [Chloroflexota bacterium]